MYTSVDQIMDFLAEKGSPAIKKIYERHGAKEPFFGVKVGDMKTIVKAVKKNQSIAEALFNTLNGDAQYLAGLIADEKTITESTLIHWAENATWYMVSEYTVPWVAAESAFGWNLAEKWISDQREPIAAAGWCTYTSLLALTPNTAIDTQLIDRLFSRIQTHILTMPNRVKHAMNGFLIALGIYLPEYAAQVIAFSTSLGPITIDFGNTACTEPYAPDYLTKALAKGPAKKKKTVRC